MVSGQRRSVEVSGGQRITQSGCAHLQSPFRALRKPGSRGRGDQHTEARMGMGAGVDRFSRMHGNLFRVQARQNSCGRLGLARHAHGGGTVREKNVMHVKHGHSLYWNM